MDDKERTPASHESRSRRKVVAKRILLSSSKERGSGHSGQASRDSSPCVASMSVHKELEGVEEEGDELDNSFDHNDDLSVSLPSASEGEDVVEVSSDGVSMPYKEKRGRKRLLKLSLADLQASEPHNARRVPRVAGSSDRSPNGSIFTRFGKTEEHAFVIIGRMNCGRR
ncbi:hypothetical protein PAHAL_1G116100 [Panicum hallii]|uniref:Uncharacterized protein n=1 Tax=Panicum hallii TaxID=206008 RepID=A0A2S3GN44_9POAL|nr:hypothetical protein PAHAL_1G116100 [Panicum hallii]